MKHGISLLRNVKSVMPLMVMNMYCLEKVTTYNNNNNDECYRSNKDFRRFYNQ